VACVGEQTRLPVSRILHHDPALAALFQNRPPIVQPQLLYKVSTMTKAITPELSTPTSSHRQLDAFIGKWHAEGASYADGQQAADPLASAVPWRSNESYEWLPGGFFVLHRWDAMIGERVFKGTQILGFDGNEGGFFTRLFDNAGNHPEYHAEVVGDTWTFTDKSTRATVTIANDGNEMRFNWEWREDGEKWLPLCDRVARRVAAEA
jgi:hypothetical protein